MAIFKAYYLIRAVAAAHIFLGYVLLTAPGKLVENSTVVILGEALGLQQPRSSLVDNPLASALAGLLLILLGISDMTSVGAAEEVTRDYWGSQAPIRTLFFAALTGYCYIYKQGRGNVNPGSDHPVINSLIFSWAFLEAVWWFWIFTNLREERNDAIMRILERKKALREMELNED